MALVGKGTVESCVRGFQDVWVPVIGETLAAQILIIQKTDTLLLTISPKKLLATCPGRYHIYVHRL